MQQEERLPPLDLDVLSPLTLRFRDAAAEAQYDSDRTKLWALADVWYKRLGLVVVVFFVAFNADSFRVCFWPVAHMQGLVVLHTALQHYLGPERFAAWRTFITVPIRLSGQVATLSLMASLAPFKGPRWHLVIAAASLFQGLRFVGGESATGGRRAALQRIGAYCIRALSGPAQL